MKTPDKSTPITRREFIKRTSITYTGFLAAGIIACSENGDKLKTTSKPNIVLLMTDQHRGDCLGCAGNEIIKTANIDSIAKDGVVFTNG